MARTSYTWYNVTAKLFITVVGIFGLALMTIATYDMVQTLDKAKLSNKIREDILLGQKINRDRGYKDKDGTLHAIPGTGSGEGQEYGTTRSTFEQGVSPTERYSNSQTESNGDWNTPSPTEEATLPNQRQSSSYDPSLSYATSTFQYGNGLSVESPSRQGNPVIFPQDTENEFGGNDIDVRGRNPAQRYTRQYLHHLRYRRQVAQENSNGGADSPSKTSTYESSASEDNEELSDGQKTYRGILVACQIVSIILGFMQLVSASGIVFSCSPYVPKRVKQWLVINIFVLLVGFLCLIIPLTIDPGSGSLLETSKVKDNLVVKYGELKDIQKKEDVLRNLYLYSVGVNEAFLLITIIVVSSLLPCGTQPYDPVY